MKNNENTPRKVLIRPFKYVTDSVAMEATKMIALLMAQIVLLFISKSYSSLLIVVAAVAGSLSADFFSHKFSIMRQTTNFHLSSAPRTG